VEIPVAWKLLIDRYEARTYADVSHVIRELHTKVYVPGTPMQKHLTEMRGLQQKLILMGSRIDNDMLGRIILTSTKDAFPTTVEILRSREPPPTLQGIIDRLLSKESEVARVESFKAPEEDQIRYTNKLDNRKPWKKHAKDKCLYCHNIGHHANECRFKKRDMAKGIHRKCLPTKDAELNVLQHTEEGFILATSTAKVDLSGVWIVDSACTADVSGDKSQFCKLFRNGLVTLKLANNASVTSNQSGQVKIQIDQALDRPRAMFVPGLTKNLLSLRLLLQDGFRIAK
jgi:gag-polypeptide of LTR copia-type